MIKKNCGSWDDVSKEGTGIKLCAATDDILTSLTEILNYNPSERLKQKLSLINTTDYIDFMTILEAVGIVDAIWCLRTQDYKDYCLFLADVAESVLPIFEAEYPDDKRPRQAIDGIRAWHNGDIDREQLYILSDAAFAAAAAAFDAAYNAAADAYAIYYAAAGYAAAGFDAAYAVNVARAAGSDWEKIEKLFIKHFS